MAIFLSFLTVIYQTLLNVSVIQKKNYVFSYVKLCKLFLAIAEDLEDAMADLRLAPKWDS